MAKPILKWAGGKTQLLEELYSNFPEDYRYYHEPMIGSGALLFDIEPEKGSLNDMNPRLSNFYRVVKEHPEELIEVLEGYRDPESEPDRDRGFSRTDRKENGIENYYYQQRALFNCRPNNEDFDEIEEAALLLYLNRTCYNGLYRENKKGEFNVPIGRYKNPDWIQRNRIKNACSVLDGIEILNKDIEYIVDYSEKNDLVYFDPPYEPVSSTADFTEYSADGFNRSDQIHLLDVATELDSKGVNVILSNSGVIYDLYKDRGLNIESVNAKRAINSDASNRGDVEEIIAKNYE